MVKEQATGVEVGYCTMILLEGGTWERVHTVLRGLTSPLSLACFFEHVSRAVGGTRTAACVRR